MAAGAASSAASQANFAILIAEIVSPDGNLTAGLRAVYETETDPALFKQQLEAYNARVKDEIERLCGRNYKEFVDSIKDLLTLGRHMENLKQAIMDCRDHLHDVGGQLHSSAQQVSAARRRQHAILSNLEAITLCLPTLRLFRQAKQQLLEKRTYAALKSLQTLETQELPKLSAFPFALRLQAQIPELRNLVRQDALEDMRQYLSAVRSRCQAIGRQALREAVADGTGSYLARRQENEEAQLDYSLLYRSLHISRVLNTLPTFSAYYCQEREKQAELVLQPSGLMENETTYRHYFHAVAGFFLAERVVSTTTQGLTTGQWLDSLWQKALTQIGKVMEAQLARCTTASMIREVKDVIVIFITTLKNNGYSVNRLTDVLLQVRSRYQDVLVLASGEAFRSILAEDNYTPLSLANEAEQRDLGRIFPLEELGQELSFPRSLAYSWAVPRLYAEMKQFVDMTAHFLANIELSNTEVDEMLRQSTNHLLSKVLSGVLCRVVREHALSVQQLTQFSVNTTHLQTSCDELEKYITGITHSVGNDAQITRLHGAEAFKDARSAAEDGIFQSLQQQIDQFLELAEYDWAPAEPKESASEYIFEMLAYLTTIFASLTNMPADVARTAYLTTCKYISNQLLGMIQRSDIKKVNLNGIRNFSLDVQTCEEYAESCPVVARGDELLKDVFVNLRELVDLFLKEDWDKYCDDNLRRQFYPHLRPEVALAWVEKFDDSAKGGLFSRRSGENRRKAKEVDGILKRLRALMGAV